MEKVELSDLLIDNNILGEGGFAKVYKGTDRRTGKCYAVKMVK
jgi:serine/threonine protein kinase